MAKVNSLRVLVVDDFEVVKLLMRNALKRLGIAETTEASDGKEALKLLHDAHAEGRPFQLVLCDWNMPEMNGEDFIHEIRQSPQFAGLKIVLITATSNKNELSEAFKQGVTDYIVKPIAPDDLQKKLELILKKAA